MADTLQLTKREAQALAVIASRLDRRPFSRRVRADDILDVFRHLGMIQLDTISVISRSHETVLWSRLGNYDPDLISELFVDRNALSEYLAHAAAIVPTEDLYLFRPYMERVQARDERWIREPGNAAIANAVIERITQQGPMCSRDFDAPEAASRSGQWESWYGSKPEREALAHLWYEGKLLVHLRDRAFARWFDLSHRVRPGLWDGEAIELESAQRVMIRQALRALGVTTVKWSSDYYRTGGPVHVNANQTRRILNGMAASGEAVPIEVEGLKGSAWMDPALTERLTGLRARQGWPTLTTLLSPFDNLIWNRDRGEQLWDFPYRIEIYVPAPRRVYGYYSMPILHRGRIVGRLDPSFDRKRKHLTVRSLHLEPAEKPTSQLARAIGKALDDLVLFLGGDTATWAIERTTPDGFADLVGAN